MSDTTSHTHISPEMADAVGTTLGRRVSFPIGESDIRRWALAVYHPEQPPARFLHPVDLPMTAPEELNPFAWAAAEEESTGEEVEGHDPDRIERSVGVPPPGLVHQLNGGMAVRYGAAMRAGDVITSVRRLGGYSERQSRLGLMLLTTFEDVWTNQHGAVVRTTTSTLIRY